MEKHKIKINFSSALVRKPLTQELIRSFPGLDINILSAQVSPQGGWIEITMTGENKDVNNAIAWIKKQGVEIRKLGG